jgi:hypothetical protein
MGYYLFAILPNINTALLIVQTIAVVAAIPLTIAVIGYWMDAIDDFEIFEKIRRWFYPFLICITLLNTFIPSQRQLAFIIAAPYIIENEDLQQAGKNTTEIIKLGTEYLKEILNDSNGTDKES